MRISNVLLSTLLGFSVFTASSAYADKCSDNFDNCGWEVTLQYHRELAACADAHKMGALGDSDLKECLSSAASNHSQGSQGCQDALLMCRRQRAGLPAGD
jgi:hypothetical protein